MNILYSDSHAGTVDTPNCGASVTSDGQQDCIFTTYGTAGGSDHYPQDGIDYGGKLGNATHTGNRDTYLWGGAAKP